MGVGRNRAPQNHLALAWKLLLVYPETKFTSGNRSWNFNVFQLLQVADMVFQASQHPVFTVDLIATPCWHVFPHLLSGWNLKNTVKVTKLALDNGGWKNFLEHLLGFLWAVRYWVFLQFIASRKLHNFFTVVYPLDCSSYLKFVLLLEMLISSLAVKESFKLSKKFLLRPKCRRKMQRWKRRRLFVLLEWSGNRWWSISGLVYNSCL